MKSRSYASALVALLVIAAGAGCNSPYRSDQGALFGGLTGAGLGALVGSASGHTGAGAAIGAGVGALSGAAVGGSLDDIEAQNRAEIAAHLGSAAPTGSVTIDDVVQMTRAGVPENVIVTHIRNHGAGASAASQRPDRATAAGHQPECRASPAIRAAATSRRTTGRRRRPALSRPPARLLGSATIRLLPAALLLWPVPPPRRPLGRWRRSLEILDFDFGFWMCVASALEVGKLTWPSRHAAENKRWHSWCH